MFILVLFSYHILQTDSITFLSLPAILLRIILSLFMHSSIFDFLVFLHFWPCLDASLMYFLRSLCPPFLSHASFSAPILLVFQFWKFQYLVYFGRICCNGFLFWFHWGKFWKQPLAINAPPTVITHPILYVL